MEENYEYSSGESDLFGMFHTTFDELDPDQKKERARYLWKLAFEKSRSASKIVQMYQLNLQKMQLLGIKKIKIKNNPKMDIKNDQESELTAEEIKLKMRWLLHPESRFKTIWDRIVIFVLIYTGTYFIYSASFLD